MSSSASSDPANAPSAPTDTEYPEQLHAGKVGLGPNYRTGPTFGDKLTGIGEEIKGKITRNSNLSQHGHDVISGEQLRKDREADDKSSPFKKADDEEKQPQANPAGAAHTSGSTAKEQAATVAPEGSDAAEVQRKGEAVDKLKHVGTTDT